MKQEELLSTINMNTYTPPGKGPGQQHDTQMTQLQERSKAQSEAAASMWAQLQQQATDSLASMKRPNAMTYLPKR